MDLQEQFDAAVADMRARKGFRTETDLDEYVEAALKGLADDPFDEDALRAAKAALQQQISGENSRRRGTIMRIALARSKE